MAEQNQQEATNPKPSSGSSGRLSKQKYKIKAAKTQVVARDEPAPDSNGSPSEFEISDEKLMVKYKQPKYANASPRPATTLGLNARKAISRLPTELLTTIFFLRICEERNPIKELIKLEYTCFHWYTVIINTPLLWFHIQIHRPKLVPLVLERSEGKRLLVDAHLHNTEEFTVWNDPFGVIDAEELRVVELSVFASLGTIIQLPVRQLPFVERLTLSDMLADEKDEVKDYPVPWTPNLKHLTIQGIHVKWSQFSNLTSLAIDELAEGRPWVRQIQAMLLSSPQLRYLSLTELAQDPHVEAEDIRHLLNTSVYLPKLEGLNLTHCYRPQLVEYLVTVLDAPACHLLIGDFTFDQLSRPGSGLKQLMQIPVTRLQVSTIVTYDARGIIVKLTAGNTDNIDMTDRLRAPGMEVRIFVPGYDHEVWRKLQSILPLSTMANPTEIRLWSDKQLGLSLQDLNFWPNVFRVTFMEDYPNVIHVLRHLATATTDTDGRRHWPHPSLTKIRFESWTVKNIPEVAEALIDCVRGRSLPSGNGKFEADGGSKPAPIDSIHLPWSILEMLTGKREVQHIHLHRGVEKSEEPDPESEAEYAAWEGYLWK